MKNHENPILSQSVHAVLGYPDPKPLDARLIAPKSDNQAKANAIQIGGQHYKGKAIQPWDYIAANGLGYFEGNIVKYVSRWRDKGGVDDLRKARHYLDKLIELEDNQA